MAQLQVVPHPETDPGVVAKPLPEPLPTWRRAQTLWLSRQNEDWASAILPVGSMLRDALGIEEKEARTAQDMLDIINFGHSVRTTHQTVANDTSSRSHAICCVAVKDASG
jgi:hypothetical protein